ncbi:MAG: hypothetical protein IKS96_10505 [Fibrobacter sp.]|nr:hypothetical protein [Fibrobacter sp.]
MMKRVAVLIFCLVAYSVAGWFELSPLDRKIIQNTRFYFELSAGGMYSVSDYKTKSKTNYYHDLERDEMVYDKDLYYDIYSFEGGSPLLDSKVGFLLFKRVALFLNLGCFWSIGEYRYKISSRDKEEYFEDDARFRFFGGVGLKWYPVVNEQNPLNGIFLGTSFKLVSLFGNEKSREKYGMYYVEGESFIEFEIGKVWNISDSYSLGFSVKVAGGFGGETEKVDGFRVDANREQDDDDITLNSKHIGAAITLVRK